MLLWKMLKPNRCVDDILRLIIVRLMVFFCGSHFVFAAMLNRHRKKRAPRKEESINFIASYNKSKIANIELTAAHFLDAYSKGKWNLSEVPKPKCFTNVNFMIAPPCYNELNRFDSVEKYKKLPQWDDKPFFKNIISNLRKSLSVNGVSISIVTQNKVIIKHSHGLDINEIDRMVSIDSHAILSQDWFILYDASKDWRTAMNPLVTGIPYIKFYCGTPLTYKNELIGVLSVFDTYVKTPEMFGDKKIQQLQTVAQEIMSFLNRPMKTTKPKVNLKFNENTLELNELRNKLGRATSRGSAMTVFEKDGSGGPYLHNNNFKFFTKLTNYETQESNNNKLLMERLVKIDNLKKACNFLCKILSVNYQINFVYILEIRAAEAYSMEAKYFPPNVIKIESDKFNHADKLVKSTNTENEFMTRIMGSFGSKHQALNFENIIHYESFISEFGIHYKNERNDTLYNSGILMPFFRYNSKLVKQKLKGDVLNVSLRSGGYLIGAFNEDQRKFDIEVISRIFNNVGILRKVYI